MGRMFGTDGVRGIANTELTSEIAYGLGRAGAYVLTEGTHKPKILVAKDTRISGDMLEAALVSGILSVGAEAVILGVVYNINFSSKLSKCLYCSFVTCSIRTI